MMLRDQMHGNYIKQSGQLNDKKIQDITNKSCGHCHIKLRDIGKSPKQDSALIITTSVE